jgi:alkanesulfonate monooxygenase SsuD/methylene tetrahydromethanopterin reductase-like flavin-dependent oxidoreductase (luciferase family)
MFGSIKEMAKAAGRDPSTLEMIVRANLQVSDKPFGKDRFIFSGTKEQIQEDIVDCQRIGASEIDFDPTFSPEGSTLEGWLSLLEDMRRLTEKLGAA